MDKTLGQYLRSIRKQNKLSIRDVKKETGITTSQLSRLECDITHSPSPIVLKKLASFYNINLIYMYIKAGFLESKDVDSYMESYFKGIEKLNQEDQKQIQSQIDYLIFQHEREREDRNDL